MIDKRIEGITEEYYKKVIYPKQSLTVPERQALEQLRISVGLDSKRGLLPLPMTNDDASRVYETFKAQMDMAEAMRNNVRPQFGNDQPPGDSFPNFNSGAFYSGGGGGGSGFDSISNIDPNESKIAPGSDSW